jgi:Fusaric acid resistance protein-like
MAVALRSHSQNRCTGEGSVIFVPVSRTNFSRNFVWAFMRSEPCFRPDEVMASIQKQDGEAIRRPLAGFGQAVAMGGALAIACLISYALITHLLSKAYFVSQDDGLLGGMWAVVATVFVYCLSYQQSLSAALSRMAPTLLSFVLCLVYLLIFKFSARGMAALIGIGAIVLTRLGRSEDIITTGITTAVMMVVAGISPQHAWIQPILRLVDTVVGIGVGIVAARISLIITSDIDLTKLKGNAVP